MATEEEQHNAYSAMADCNCGLTGGCEKCNPHHISPGKPIAYMPKQTIKCPNCGYEFKQDRRMEYCDCGKNWVDRSGSLIRTNFMPKQKDWENKVGEAVGSASMCWQPTPTGVFDTEKALKVSNELTVLISDLLAKQREEVLNDLFNYVEQESGKSGRQEILNKINQLKEE